MGGGNFSGSRTSSGGVVFHGRVAEPESELETKRVRDRKQRLGRSSCGSKMRESEEQRVPQGKNPCGRVGLWGKRLTSGSISSRE